MTLPRWTCKDCKTYYESEDVLDEHYRKKHSSKCGICKGVFGLKLKEHIRNEHAKEKRNVLIVTFLVIMIAYSIIIIHFTYTHSSSSQNLFEILKYGLILLAIGFLICALRYSHIISNFQKLYDRNEWLLIFLNSYDEQGKSLEDEKRSRVFSIIFGFLASLAITEALGTYYDHFIQNLPLSTFFTLQNILSVDLIPTLRLIIFFVIAIPLTHSGYRFLSNLITNNLSINKWNKEKNDISGLIAIFIISIIQVSFLFFLAESVVITIPESSQITQGNEEAASSQPTKPETLEEKTNSLFIYLFWLTLTMSMASVGAGLVKIIIKNNRIPLEWIFLYAIVTGFLISIIVLIPIKGPLNDEEIQMLTVIILGVLTTRSVLDYFIGRNIYFEPDTKSTA